MLCVLLRTVKARCTCSTSAISAYKSMVTSTSRRIAIFLSSSRIFYTCFAIIAIRRRILWKGCPSRAFRACNRATSSLEFAQCTLHTRASKRSCKASVTHTITVYCVDSTARRVGSTCNTHSSCCVRVVISSRARHAL